MIQTYKMINKVDDIDYRGWFQINGNNQTVHTRNRACRLNIVKTGARTEIRRNFFTIRIQDMWNGLPNKVKESRSLRLFKENYDEHQGHHETARRLTARTIRRR